MDLDPKATVRVRIDGKMVQAPAGSTILDVAKSEGIYVPTLCYSPLVRPLENCRMCIVAVAGERQYKAACSTPVVEGMEITTNNENLRQTRKLLLELLLDTHYGDCVAPCSVACPANVDIQGYMALIRHGEYREAVKLIKEKIPMPATIGRVCPHTCEDACRRHLVDKPLAINGCKRFVADYEMLSGERVLPVVPKATGRRVAIVGGGPSGLSAAYYLRSLGHGVTIFEAREKLGGMLRYGIPDYRLPQHILDWEIEGILSLGVDVRTGVTWGKDFTLDELGRENYDAIFVGIGAWASRKLGIVGEELKGVVSGVEILEHIAAGKPVEIGKRVVVVGGGNVAIDAARSALRLGSKEVTILYRRSRKEMPANQEEIEAAEAEGVNIQLLAAPTQLMGSDGVLRQLQFIRMELGEPDASGRRRPVAIEGSEMTMEIDQVISAIGQYPLIPVAEQDGIASSLPLTRWSTIGGDPRTMYTGQNMIFVGGDTFHGPLTVVTALADGRRAAYSLDRFFRAGRVQPEPIHFNISKGDLNTIDREPFTAMKIIHREHGRELEVADRVGSFKEVELGFAEEQAQREAARCLECGCSAAFDCKLRGFLNEFEVEWRNQPSKKIHYQRVAAVDVHPLISLDPNKCIRCERCYVACDTYQCSDAIYFKNWPSFNDRCVQCGMCIDLCPTGALSEKRDGRAVERLDWKSVPTHCTHCGCGCGLQLKLAGERLAWIADGSQSAPNWSSTCRRGRFHAYDTHWYGKRLESPAVQKKGGLRKVSLGRAIEAVLTGFKDVREKYGPKAIYALASPECTNESLYLLQKWVRMGLKSNGLDYPGRTAQERLWSILKELKDAEGGTIQELSGLERVDAIFVCGAGVEDLTPVVGTMIRRAVSRRRTSLLQLSDHPDGLTPFASVAVHAAPEHWIASLQSAIGGGGGVSGEWEGLESVLRHAPSLAVVFPETLLTQEHGVEIVKLLARLAAMKQPSGAGDGTGIYPAMRDANSAGAFLAGVTPNYLPGMVSVTGRSAHGKILETWQVTELPEGTWPGIEEALDAGQVKGLFVQHASQLLDHDPDLWEKRLRGVEFLVVQDYVPSIFSDLAQVVLPSAAFGEQSGSIVNMERRLLALQAGLRPPGEALADWEMLARIAAAQGVPFPHGISAVHQEINELVPQFANLRRME